MTGILYDADAMFNDESENPADYQGATFETIAKPYNTMAKTPGRFCPCGRNGKMIDGLSFKRATRGKSKSASSMRKSGRQGL